MKRLTLIAVMAISMFMSTVAVAGTTTSFDDMFGLKPCTCDPSPALE